MSLQCIVRVREWFMEDAVFVSSNGNRVFLNLTKPKDKDYGAHTFSAMNAHLCYSDDRSKKRLYATRMCNINHKLKQMAEKKIIN